MAYLLFLILSLHLSICCTTTNLTTSQRLCLEINPFKANSYDAAYRQSVVTIIVEVAEYFQTIESFVPTTLYTPSDGIPRLHILDPPTRSANKNVTAIQTKTIYHVLPDTERGSKISDPAPCKNDTFVIDPFRSRWSGVPLCSTEWLSYYAEISQKKIRNDSNTGKTTI